MKILINNEEHVTVSCNHLEGDPTKHHALTISNYGGFLNCREFNRPEEKEESSATDNQQAIKEEPQADITPICDNSLCHNWSHRGCKRTNGCEWTPA